MTKSRKLASEDGWVMVPVIVLMVAGMIVAFALLAIVDTQTGESRDQRSRDAAQTLAEGVVSSTANVLADSASAPVWKIEACEPVSGDLTAASTAPVSSFAAKLTAELQERFGGSSEYAASESHNTTWRVDVCPVATADARWDDGFLTRAAVTPASGPGHLWVRAQASVRSRSAATPQNTRAVASKIRQSSQPFAVPADFAVGTGVFSTDVGTALNTTTSSLLAGALTSPLIAEQENKIGVRCGLLNTVSNLTTTCVTGALAGVGGTTNALGLGALNTALGIDRAQVLGTWTMAPSDAIDAWLAEAKASGIYAEQVSGYGNVRDSSSLTGVPVAGLDCFAATPTAAQVVFIDQVGNGEQYCDVRGDATAKILIVRRGGVRISAHFTGVVYALNQKECSGAGGACSAEDRTAAVPREVVRLEGNNGRVTGSVWADGAGGSVGIYPSLNLGGTNTSLNNLLVSLGGDQGICGLPLLGPVLDGLGQTVNGLTGVVGNLLTSLLGTTQVQEEVRYAGGASAPTGCGLLTSQLKGLGTSQLVNLFGSGGSEDIVISERRTRTRTCKTWLVACLAWNPYSAWTGWATRDSQEVTLPALLNSGTPSLVEQVAGVLASTLNDYQAIVYDQDAVENAAIHISHGAAPEVGTYRNLRPAP